MIKKIGGSSPGRSTPKKITVLMKVFIKIIKIICNKLINPFTALACKIPG